MRQQLLSKHLQPGPKRALSAAVSMSLSSGQPCASSAEVPIRWNAIQQIMGYYYSEPALLLLQEEYKVIGCKSWAEDAAKMKASPVDVKPVIPTEHLMAFALMLCCYIVAICPNKKPGPDQSCWNLRAACRDLKDEKKWKPGKLRSFKFGAMQTSHLTAMAAMQIHSGQLRLQRATRDDDIFWLAQNNRQSKKAAGLSMTLTCLQKMYSVLNHKARVEKANGGKGMSLLPANQRHPR